MPYAQNNLKDEELKNQQAGSAPNISGTSTTFSTGVPGQESSKKSSGQYANIQSYLDTNQEQAGEMGNKLASGVEQKGQEAKTGIDTLSKSVNKIDAYDPSKTIGKITGFNTNQYDPNSGPQAPDVTQEEKDQYKTIKQTGGYTGPSDLSGVSGYQDVETKARQASEAAKNASTELGQQALLKETYARPTYSAGQNKLDQVLLGGSKTGKEALQNVSGKYSGLEDLFKDTSTQVGNTINENINTAMLNKEAFNPLEKAAREALLNPIQARAQQKNIDSPAAIARAQEDLSDETVYDDILSRTGLQQGTKIYDLNLASYLNPNQTQNTVNNVATNDERVKYQALSDLFGDASMNQITSSGKAINPYTFDKDKFEADRYARENEFLNVTAPSQNLTSNFYNQDWASDANVNLADYLKRGEDAITYSDRSNWGDGAFVGQNTQQAYLRDQAKARLINQINQLLDQQKYNRVINVRQDKQGPKENLGSGSFGG